MRLFPLVFRTNIAPHPDFIYDILTLMQPSHCRCLALSVTSAVLALLPASAGLQAGTIGPYSQTTIVSGLGLIAGAGPDNRSPGPSGMAVTPDGRVLITNLDGTVQVVQNGALVASPAIKINVLSVTPASDRGLMSIAVDPHFSSNGYVYLYYVSPDANGTTFHNTLSRFTMTGNTLDPASEHVVIQLPVETISTNVFHMGGGMAFGADGHIYLGVGDQASATNVAQDLGSYYGKILRLNPDGSTPSDNPFVSRSGAVGDIYAYGLRNPFSLSVQPGTNNVFVNDVGEASWEEIDALTPGADYGWNQAEGPDLTGQTANPYYYYPHNFSLPFCSGAIVGGTYSASLSPAFTANQYYFGDFCAGTINGINVTGTPVVTPLATGLGFLVATAAAPDGGLYYLTRSYTGVLGEIQPVPEPGGLAAFGVAMLLVVLRRASLKPAPR